MLIIIEGIDCSGKGWLADYILKKGPQPMIYLKQGHKPRNKEMTERGILEIAYSAMLASYRQSIDYKGCHAIFDRFYPSELAYAETMRGYDPWSGNNFHSLETEINSIEHALVYVQTPKEVILERMKERGEDYITEKDLEGLMRGYDTFMRKTSINNVIRWNSLEVPPEDLLESIMEQKEKRYGAFVPDEKTKYEY